MYHLPNLLVAWLIRRIFLTRCVVIRPCDRHCIRIWLNKLNKPITVLRLIGFSNKNELNVCSWLRNVPCSKTLFLVIRLRLCLEVKVQYPYAKSPKLLVLAITLQWIVGFLYEFNKRLTPTKGYVTHSKQNSIFKVKVVLRGQRRN